MRCRIVGLVAESTPHTLKGARVRVENNDSTVHISVSDKQLVGLRIDIHVSGGIYIRSVKTAFTRPWLANLQQELPVLRKF